MENTRYPSLLSYIRGSGLLLISTGAALCLFLEPSKYTIALMALIFGLTAMAALLEGPKEKRKLQPECLAAAAVFAAIGMVTFRNAWIHSGILGAVAGAVGLPVSLLAAAVAVGGGAVGLYAFYCLARRLRDVMADVLPQGGSVGENLRKNWYFPLSAAAFLLAHTSFETGYFLTVPAAVAAAMLAASVMPDLFSMARKAQRNVQLLALITGAAICLTLPYVGGVNWFAHAETQLPAAMRLWFYAGAVLSAPFVWLCLVAFWQKLSGGLCRALKGTERGDWIVAGAVFALLLIACAVIFFRTDAFYGTPYSYDILYTSDSPMLVKENAYMTLANAENDLRQPLFGIFSMPFAALPALASVLTGASAPANALLLNSVQLALLVLMNMMIALMTGLKGRKRQMFFLVLSACYPAILFAMMMEQYIVACFYLVLFLRLWEQDAQEEFFLWGTGGTLLTGLILLPVLGDAHPIRAFRAWFRQMLRYGMAFVAVLLVFGRVEVILEFSDAMGKMGGFSGEKLGLAGKLMQYSVFVASCLFAPAGEAVKNVWGQPSWQLLQPERFHMLGIAIFWLCLLGAVSHRKNRGGRIAALWLAFSLAVLVLLGWGTQENGLILYGLYFGWTVPVLLLGLLRNTRLRLGKVGMAIGLMAFLLLAAVNLSGFFQLLQMALAQYPL